MNKDGIKDVKAFVIEDEAGVRKAAVTPSETTGKISRGKDTPGMSRKEIHIPREAIIRKTLLLPNLSDTLPIIGASIIVAIIKKLAKKNATPLEILFISIKKVPAQVV
ncbi:hypothetical protein AKJ47_01575 [candidate division MSBL1 archaeon SCGC-AAA261G05]|uniref:Uncharacterized protein n=1 Tax=candidate division MSBL1 archaeon SCGC-AAA261G05 TaxID=1698276 RepID=A0A133VBP5_9EURY|nr:hypothetical protein AKJ47_01575 [candidate division MSBL1 archaeon SCGC-AAA261G05]